MVEQLRDNSIKLKRVFIESQLPEPLQPLLEMANNLWWSWNKEASSLFRQLDPEHWLEKNANPIDIIDGITVDRAQSLLADKAFMQQLESVYQSYQAYHAEAPRKDSPGIAYFSMEYGLHLSVRLYSGGLGILAGDYLKEASDQNLPLVAVGLLYRYGYFQQSISLHGDQINNYLPQEFTKLPIQPVRDNNGEWVRIGINLPGRTVWAKVWVLQVGRIPLYLLDTDINENSWGDRTLTHQLYGGDNEHRLKQELLLGIGGMRALEAIGHDAAIYHCNEGHAAFLGLERLKYFIKDRDLSYEEALEIVRASSLFTTHTPVPAGHDYFSEHQLHNYLHDYVREMGMSWERFLALGKIDPHNEEELFSMSHLAIRLSQEVNGVSKLHGEVSQKMFKPLYPGYNFRELHIDYVTNAVHYPTWVAEEWHQIFVKTFGEGFVQHQSDPAHWRHIHDVPDQEIMATRQLLKTRLLDYVKEKLRADLTRRGEKPGNIFEVLNHIQYDTLVVGFARRFATYKRAHLLFTNLDRLREIVNNEERPVMFLFAGKAHPADAGGQGLIKRIVEISKHPEFIGKIIFLESYNMEMAKLLVRGVDIWLNTPTRPLEASGTSGMKAAINGVMNFSVLDGWWAEGYRPDAGWALPMESTYDDVHLQDELDAETIYNVFETDIIPKFYNRDENGISKEWVSYIKNIIAEVAPYFTMKRMVDDYMKKFYQPLHERSKILQADGFKQVRQLVQWKQRMAHRWDRIEVVEKAAFDTDNYALKVGDAFRSRIKLRLDGIPAEEVGLELLLFKRLDEDRLELRFTKPFELMENSNGTALFECEADPQMSGVFEYGFRLFPQHPHVPHKQDFALVRWL